jgi:hypothetical protein
MNFSKSGIITGESGSFFCPKCDDFTHWGTSSCTGPSESWTGHCHGTREMGCGFSWPRTEDAKYFRPRDEAQLMTTTTTKED